MDYRCLKPSATLLLLFWTLASAANRDDTQFVRAYWCNRVCSNTVAPSTHVLGVPPLVCPNLKCPTPVCPIPVCPTHSPSPPTCSACPVKSPPSLRPLPWASLKSYASTPLGYYKFYSDMNLDWFDAQAHCENEGAHLVILNSEDEDRFIRKEMRPGWIHIGIHHLFPQGGFTTVLGKPINSTGYDKWLRGHSIWNVSNNCGFLNKNEGGVGMGHCSDTGRFVCEISFNR